MSFKFKHKHSQFSCDLWQSWIVENFEKYKLWSQVNEDFETGTVKSLKDIEFGGRYGKRTKLSEEELVLNQFV